MRARPLSFVVPLLASILGCGIPDPHGTGESAPDASIAFDASSPSVVPSPVDATASSPFPPPQNDGGPVVAPDGSSPGACVDVCAATNGGINWQCEKRFLFGINYAWQSFGADFGGISQWDQNGVVADEATHAKNLEAMASHGANVVRWWIFPDLRSDGVTFDGSDTPTGLGGTAVADITKALELADQANVFLMLTVFSFDAFRPTNTINELKIRGLAPIARDPQRRAALETNVIRPLARAVEASPHRHRMLAWDVINEPEWAMSGASPYGDPAYTPTPGLETLTHLEMESFVGDTVAALRAESHALVSVGGAAVKWAHAWSKLDIDFYQFHYYDWVNKSWPYTNGPTTYGLAKPLVIGEFPTGDLSPGVHYSDVVTSFFNTGFAGAMGWDFNGATPPDLVAQNAFATAHACQTHFDATAALSRPFGPRPAPPPRAPGEPETPRNVRPCHRTANGIPICDPVR